MNLDSMSIAELEKLKAAVEKEINSRKKSQRNKALGEIKSIAAKYGLSLSDVVGNPNATANKPGPKVGAKKKSAKPKQNPERPIAYRHPDNPALTWGGGRGRRPQWVKDWEASGRGLDEIKVA